MKLFDFLCKFDEDTRISLFDNKGDEIARCVVGDVTQRQMNMRILKTVKIENDALVVYSQLEDEVDTSILSEHTLKSIPVNACLQSAHYDEVVINNPDNPLFNGIYRVEYIKYIDEYESEYYGFYNYLDGEFHSDDRVRDEKVRMSAIKVSLYNSDAYIAGRDFSKHEKCLFICRLLEDDNLLKNHSLRDFCKVKKG